MNILIYNIFILVICILPAVLIIAYLFIQDYHSRKKIEVKMGYNGWQASRDGNIGYGNTRSAAIENLLSTEKLIKDMGK
jgi:Flp pilus assembly protein protease CpaA